MCPLGLIMFLICPNKSMVSSSTTQCKGQWGSGSSRSAFTCQKQTFGNCSENHDGMICSSQTGNDKVFSFSGFQWWRRLEQWSQVRYLFGIDRKIYPIVTSDLFLGYRYVMSTTITTWTTWLFEIEIHCTKYYACMYVCMYVCLYVCTYVHSNKCKYFILYFLIVNPPHPLPR